MRELLSVPGVRTGVTTMETQRVNAYKTGDKVVYFIEQFNTELKQWFTVGDTFEKYENASIMIETHNLKELLKTLA